MSVCNGDFAAALSRADTNERLDPLSADAIGRLCVQAAAQFFTREFDAAIGSARGAIGRAPDFHAARCFLIASLAHAGLAEEAGAHAAELLRRDARYTMVLTGANSPFRHPWMAELFLSGLRQAGVPLS